MTVERKIVVGLDDLRALTFECKDCRSRVTVSPDQARVPQRILLRLGERCPNCGREWVRYPPPENRVTLSNHVNLIDAIGKIRAQEKGSDEWPKFRVLLEFDEPEMAGRKESN
jgi:hypothetical protein